MKTKIDQLFFTTAFLIALHIGTPIGGPTLPPKPASGPAYTATDSQRSLAQGPQSLLNDVKQN